MTARTCYVCAHGPGDTVPATEEGCCHLATDYVPSERHRWGLCAECAAAGPCPECDAALDAEVLS